MKSPGPSNLPDILSWKRSLRTSQRLPETSSSVPRSSLPDGDESPVLRTTRPWPTQVLRRHSATSGSQRSEAINLHSLALGAGIAEGNLDLRVQGIPFDREC